MPVRGVLRRVFHSFNSILRPFGIEIKLARYPIRGFSRFFQFVKSRGFKPATVFDIGVGYGTWDLYRAFPMAKHVLIEALSDYQETLEKIAKAYDTDCHIVAVGDQDGEVQITVEASKLTTSSIFERSKLTKRNGLTSTRVVPCRTLDSICRTKNYQPPFLIKIDVEGAEFSVLRGAPQTIEYAEIVIAEVSVATRFVSSYELFDIVELMHERGFVVFDIVGGSNSRLGTLNFLDLVFVKQDSPLRAI